MHINPLSLSHTVVLYFTFIHVYFSPSAPHTLPCCPHTHTIIHTLLFIPSHTNTAVLCLPLLFCLTYAVPLTHTHTIILFYKQHQCFSYTPVYYNRGWNSIWEESVIACVCGRVLRFKRGLWQYVSRKVWFTACATFWNAHTRLFIQVCSRSHISPHKHAVWWANTLIEHTHTEIQPYTDPTCSLQICFLKTCEVISSELQREVSCAHQTLWASPWAVYFSDEWAVFMIPPRLY